MRYFNCTFYMCNKGVHLLVIRISTLNILHIQGSVMAVLYWQDRRNQSLEKKRLRCIKISITNIFHGCEGW